VTVERHDLVGRWAASERGGIALLLDLDTDGGYELTVTRRGVGGALVPDRGGDLERGRWSVTSGDAPRLVLTKLERSSAWARSFGLDQGSSPALGVFRRWMSAPRSVSARILEVTPSTLTVGRRRAPVVYRRADGPR
jgi:hypothetical protein